jgi:Holliday junction resolvase RusA-like endonuclease
VTLFPLTIVLAGEPVGKGRARAFAKKNGAGIGHYTPAKTRSYEAMIRSAASDMMGEAPPVEGPIEIEIIARLGIAASWSKKKREQARNGTLLPTKRPDLSNIEKAAEDALNTVVFKDDSQIVTKVSRKVFSDKPALVITVRRAWTGEGA